MTLFPTYVIFKLNSNSVYNENQMSKGDKILQKDYKIIDDPYELIFHLLSISYLYGDYAIPFHLMNTSSQAYLSVKKGDTAALRRFASRNWIDMDLLSDEKRKELEQIYQMIIDKYSNQIKTELSPLPTQFLIELGERAIQFGHFRDAHSCFKAIKGLDKQINELVGEAIQILKSKEVNSPDNEQILEQKIAQAVDNVYRATKLKNPFGNQFQKLGQQLHYEDADIFRKYSKYVELTLLKEILEFGIQFLIDDRSISEKVLNALSISKLRRLFLKKLAIRFSGGEQRYSEFVEHYHQAIEKLNQAETEKDFREIQKTLLGRGTGDNKYFQFLREISLEHPISALLVFTETTPSGELYIAPLILKSGTSLLDFLEIS